MEMLKNKSVKYGFIVLILVVIIFTLFGTFNKTNTPPSSANIYGEWVGTLPCASCPGIDTRLQLNANGQYALHTEYQEKENSKFLEKGEWSIDQDLISLKSSDSKSFYRHRFYRFAGDKLIALNQDKAEVEGSLAEFYILKKIE